ncbi:MAG: phosphoserine phosphatase SerB [Pseudomonadota bacterium]
MLVATAAAGVGDDAVGRLSAALGARLGPPRRLGADAVAFACAADASAPARAALPEAALDLNVLSMAAAAPKAVLVADMDSTIITVECVDELAAHAGKKTEVAALTEQAMAGALDFEGALRARVALLAGLSEAELEATHRDRVRLSAGAAALAGGMRARGALTALVSGGFTFFAERVAAAAGFERFQANALEIADGRLTGELAAPILGRAAKAEALRALCAERGVGAEAALAIGDGANDLDMIRAAGLGVAYRAKPAVAEAADARLDHSDLSAALRLQEAGAAARG